MWGRDSPGISRTAGCFAGPDAALTWHEMPEMLKIHQYFLHQALDTAQALGTGLSDIRIVWHFHDQVGIIGATPQSHAELLSCVGISAPFLVSQNNSGPGLSPRSRVWQRAVWDGSTSVCCCQPAPPPPWETAEVRKQLHWFVCFCLFC